MRKFTQALPLTALLAAVFVGGTAFAVEQGRPGPDEVMKAEISRAEAQAKAREMFVRLDVNKDGKLDTADRDAQRTAMFDNIDTDKNGQISRAEFDAHHPTGEGRAGHGAMGRGGEGEHGGHRMGHRQDGEHGKGHEGMGHRGAGGSMMLMRMADTNKDNAVSETEFAAASMTMFDRADANKDGKVTREERRSAQSAMRQMMRNRTPPAGN